MLFARPSCPVIAQPGALGAERINSGPLNCISPAPGPPPAFVPRPARPLCSLSLHALFGKHKTPGPAAGPFQASKPALENAARLGYLGTPPGAGRVDAERPGSPLGAPPLHSIPDTAWQELGPRSVGFPWRHLGCSGHHNVFQAQAFPLKSRGTWCGVGAGEGGLSSLLCFKWPRSSLDTEFRSLRNGLDDAPGALTSAACTLATKDYKNSGSKIIIKAAT